MTTRSKLTSTKPNQNKITAIRKQAEHRIFLLDASLIDASSNRIEIISLRNPSSENASKYLYAKQKKQFYEILNFNEEPRSWFANNAIYPNGNIYLTSPFDPLFWALYYIRQNNIDKCQPIEQTMIDDNFSKTHLIVDLLTLDELAMIADQKGAESLKAFKYNETKTLSWLSVKCKKLASELKKSNFHIGAKSLNYVKTEKADNNAQNDDELLLYAFGIVSDYISLDLCEKLSEHLGLEKAKAAIPGKRKSLIELEHNTLKRVKSEEDFSVASVETPSVKEKKVSAKEKKMAKAASGTKSISAFFSKK